MPYIEQALSAAGSIESLLMTGTLQPPQLPPTYSSHTILFCSSKLLIHARVMIVLDEPSYSHHMFSNKTTDQLCSSFDVQSQCEHLIGGDSMWRISHVNQSYRVCMFSRPLPCVLNRNGL